MQDPSTKKEEAVKPAENTNDPQQEQPTAQLTDDIEENPDYLFYDVEGGEG